MAWVIFILSFVVSGVICYLMNRNSVGTTYADATKEMKDKEFSTFDDYLKKSKV